MIRDLGYICSIYLVLLLYPLPINYSTAHKHSSAGRFFLFLVCGEVHVGQVLRCYCLISTYSYCICFGFDSYCTYRIQIHTYFGYSRGRGFTFVTLNHDFPAPCNRAAVQPDYPLTKSAVKTVLGTSNDHSPFMMLELRQPRGN